MIFRDNLFQSFEPFIASHVMTSANAESFALGKGTIEMEAVVNGKWVTYAILLMSGMYLILKTLLSVLATVQEDCAA